MIQSKTQALKILRHNQWHPLWNKLPTEIDKDDINTLCELKTQNDMTRLKIKETAYFKGLNLREQKIYGKSKSLDELVRAYNISKDGRAFELDLNGVQKGIVDELLLNKILMDKSYDAPEANAELKLAMKEYKDFAVDNNIEIK